MTEMTRDDLDKMTLKEIAKHFGVDAPKPGTKKADFIDKVIAATTEPVEVAATTAPVTLEGEIVTVPLKPVADDWIEDLKVALTMVTVVYVDPDGVRWHVNAGQEHTITMRGFPEASKLWPASWQDDGKTINTVAVDDETVLEGRLYTEHELRRT